MVTGEELNSEGTRRVRKIKIHHVYADREVFMLIVAKLPSTLILYL
jgi:hypothetical protein